jgi:hypothetical protein
MSRKTSLTCMAVVFAFALAEAWAGPPAPVNLPASAIVEKNVAARGGLQAWRSVQTLSLQGKLGAGGNQRAALLPLTNKLDQKIVPQRPVEEVNLPFLMELKRSRKMRLELQFNGQTALQVYDGMNGWKLRPYLNRRVVEPFTAEELKSASLQADLDGPLVDYAAKGTRIELAGMEKVDGHDTYNLKLTLKSGEAMHVWIDAQTFLETKIEGQPRRMDGTYHPVEIYFRDYREVNGLQIPYLLETRVLPVAKTALGGKDTPVPPEQIIIDKVVVNPKLDDSQFLKPDAGVAPPAVKSKAS